MWIYRVVKNAIYTLLGKQTVGARALVVNKGEVLLVQHTYMSGWYTIGGGVESGESPMQAIIRELEEEVGVFAASVKLFNVYYSQAEKRDDYVAFYICEDFVEKDIKSTTEIKEKRWFKLDNLPEGTSPATIRRIKEYLGEIEKSDRW